MKAYDIFDNGLSISIGTLLYFEKDKSFIIELEDCLDEWTAPLLFMNSVKNGVFTILREASFMWVKGRIIPRDRQNINMILSNHKLSEYDELKLLEISSGICSQDDVCVKRISELPDYVVNRAKKCLRDCTPLSNNRLLCMFNDGTIKIVKLSDIDTYNIINADGKYALFGSAIVCTGGYSVIFGGSIEVPASTLYQLGLSIPLTVDDFIDITNKNVLDSKESCDILGCSRQNLAFLVNKGEIEPIKQNKNGNLYLKGDVVRSTW